MNDSLQTYDSVDCDGCGGIVYRECVDFDPELGVSYEPRLGCSKLDRHSWLCAACTAAEIGFTAEYGCSIAPLHPPRAEREYRLAFELERAA